MSIRSFVVWLQYNGHYCSFKEQIHSPKCRFLGLFFLFLLKFDCFVVFQRVHRVCFTFYLYLPLPFLICLRFLYLSFLWRRREWLLFIASADCSQPSIFSYFYLIVKCSNRIARELNASPPQSRVLCAFFARSFFRDRWKIERRWTVYRVSKEIILVPVCPIITTQIHRLSIAELHLHWVILMLFEIRYQELRSVSLIKTTAGSVFLWILKRTT